MLASECQQNRHLHTIENRKEIGQSNENNQRFLTFETAEAEKPTFLGWL
jgi:hypothetical protein